MRAALVLMHRYCGLATALFLSVAGLTGSAITFMPELEVWLNPGLFLAPGGDAAMPLSDLVSRVEMARPALTVATVVMPAAPGQSLSLFVQPRTSGAPLANDQLFIDPATGSILGERSYAAFRPDAAHVLPFLRRVHYSLHIPGMAGIWLMGLVALVWMLDCVVGLVLTLPRGVPFWRKWSPMWRIKRKAGVFRLNIDLHRVGSLWLWPVLFLLALTSVALNLPNELFRPMLATLLPTNPPIWDAPADQPPHGVDIGFGGALSAAQGEAARRAWRERPAKIFRLVERGQYLVTFNGDRMPGFGASALIVGATTGAIRRVDEAGAGPSGDLVANLMAPMHTGDAGGLPGRILIFLSGLIVTMLSVTGVYIWWKKRSGRIVRRRRSGGLHVAAG